jgi:hypothetical protein
MSDLEEDIRAKLEFCKKKKYSVESTKTKLLQILKGPNDKSLAL